MSSSAIPANVRNCPTTDLFFQKEHLLTIMNACEVGGVWKIVAGVRYLRSDGDVSRAIPHFLRHEQKSKTSDSSIDGTNQSSP
jgi:hypothetical protein